MAKDSENDPFQSAFLEAFPNPERIGCPSKDILYKISRQKLPVDHPAIDHIAQCSPCFREIRLLQEDRTRSTTTARMAVAALLIAGTAAGVMYLALRPPWMNQSDSLQKSKLAKSTQEQEPQIAILNFEMLSRERGGSPQGSQPLELQRIPRDNLSLSMYLPKGSEPGKYQVSLLRAQSDETPLVSASGTARIENGLTVLAISIDFSHVEAGTYVIAFRHDSESWRYAAVAAS